MASWPGLKYCWRSALYVSILRPLLCQVRKVLQIYATRKRSICTKRFICYAPNDDRLAALARLVNVENLEILKNVCSVEAVFCDPTCQSYQR
jgi:hypothetical protein